MTPEPTKPFTTDGCSGGMSWFWRTFLRTPPPWEGACIRHDKAYWHGGTALDREVADRILLRSVAAQGYPVIAVLMFLAVRIGGVPWLPTPWRWNYGHSFCRSWRYFDGR